MASADFVDNNNLERLLAACAQGDRYALAEIYKATYPKFHAIILKSVKCEESANDSLQKGYLSIWMNANRFEPSKAKAFTWMLVIMRRKGIDSLRASRRTSQSEEIPDTLADESVGPHQRAELTQLGSVLEAQLAILPKQMSRAIILHVVHGYTCKEIAAQCDASSNTIKSWIRRGLDRVRIAMPYDQFETAL